MQQCHSGLLIMPDKLVQLFSFRTATEEFQQVLLVSFCIMIKSVNDKTAVAYSGSGAATGGEAIYGLSPLIIVGFCCEAEGHLRERPRTARHLAASFSGTQPRGVDNSHQLWTALLQI